MKAVVGSIAPTFCWICLASFAFQASVAQQADREHIELGKKATAFVDVGAEGTATAFCIDPAGFFVTNDHVVKGTKPGQSIKLVLNPATNDQREITAVVIRTDELLDLAVLRANEKDLKLPCLKLGTDTELFETGGVTAFGYPFGKGVSQQTTYPGISINVGRVTALQKKGGKLERLQFDAQVNPGNSGGPVIDEKGLVVGVVKSGIFATGVNYAIPVTKLKAFLNAPDVVFAPPRFNVATRYQETTLPATVRSIIAPLKDPRVELELVQEGKPSRTIVAGKSAEADQFEFRLTPIEPPDPNVPMWITGDANLKSSKLSGRIKDQVFHIAEKELRLSEVAEVQFGSEAKVKLHEGTQLVGEITGLEQISVELDDQPLQLQMAKLTKLTLQKPSRMEPEVNFSLFVKDGEQLVTRLTGKLDIEDAEAAPVKAASQPIKPLDDWIEFKGPKRNIPLPAKVEDVTVAGGGRYIILHLKSIGVAAVYDVNLVRVTKLLRMPATNCTLAGAEQCFIVAIPEEKKLERWSLSTMRKELGASFPRNGKLAAMAMGSASNGPLFMLMSANPGQWESQFVNPTDLVELKFNGPQLSGFSENSRTRASALGNLFTIWSADGYGSFHTLRLSGQEYQFKIQHQGVRNASPSFDGNLLLTSGGGAWPSDSERARLEQEIVDAMMPTTTPSLYIGVPFALENAQSYASQPLPAKTAKVIAASDGVVLGDLPALDLGVPPENRSNSIEGLSFDKRVHYIPQASQLVTIPFAGNQLIVDRVDAKAVLLQNKPERSFCISSAPRSAYKGSEYVYQIKVVSESTKLTYHLENGPMGLEVSSDGRVSWKVPSGFEQKTTRALVSIKDENGGVIYDTINIDIL